MEAAEILVIILSVAFALFLVLGIILTVILIKVAKQIKRVTTTAERAVDNLENVATIVQRVAAPAAVTRIISGIVKSLAGRGKR